MPPKWRRRRFIAAEMAAVPAGRAGARPNLAEASRDASLLPSELPSDQTGGTRCVRAKADWRALTDALGLPRLRGAACPCTPSLDRAFKHGVPQVR